ncbi:S-adenosyl-L-methionine-dependent methyltransferase [Paraphysoderma sedebokerense]|nr:S-adenosyl-L-methionine-dependent methyltransferase [Paraphysoderma sedebokerense]KAI9142346.1 S-adenosyl-L-methionine-dependent methyltransferase [Paraphysoderma sedebokerense]
MEKLRVLEFYSGIGGMHCALSTSKIDFEVVQAFEVNDIANNVYAHNFGRERITQSLIESIPVSKFNKYRADLWTMSPPCQPYSRQKCSKQEGSKDSRAKSFIYLMDTVLPSLENKPKYILIENVKGFDESDTHEFLLSQLSKLNYSYQEFHLNPYQFGIPNSRLRYYLLAKLSPLSFNHTAVGIQCDIPSPNRTTVVQKSINEYLQSSENMTAVANVPDKVLWKFAPIFDFVTPSSSASCCFTKGYYHYVEATGSMLQLTEDVDVSPIWTEYFNLRRIHFPHLNNNFRILPHPKSKHRVLLDPISATEAPAASVTFSPATSSSADSTKDTSTQGSTTNPSLPNNPLSALQMRYFTPREISNLLHFPSSFSFPEITTLKQQYRLLGNSINVYVVSELIRYMVSDIGN